MNCLEHQNYLTNPCFKECLFWAGRLYETYSDAIYDFVLTKWKNGPQFYTDDDEANKFMKLLMIILGKPTKQASAVTGSLVKRGIEGERFLMIRVLADYLLHVHLEPAPTLPNKPLRTLWVVACCQKSTIWLNGRRVHRAKLALLNSYYQNTSYKQNFPKKNLENCLKCTWNEESARFICWG